MHRAEITKAVRVTMAFKREVLHCTVKTNLIEGAASGSCMHILFSVLVHYTASACDDLGQRPVNNQVYKSEWTMTTEKLTESSQWM